MKALSLLGIAGLFLMASSVPADAFDVVINEFQADPAPDISGDANGDGVRDGSEDEFVEIYNDTGADLDMSNWEIHDAVALRHVFPEGTIIPNQCAVVVFGGGTPTGSFGGATVQTASEGFLGFNNSGDTIELKDDGGVTMALVVYGGEGGQNQSLTRDPDITGAFVLHSTATGSGGALFSPGTMIDGSQFSGCPELTAVINEFHADPAPDISGDANGDGVRDGSEDEFVEIHNNSGGELDMSAWEIHDGFGLRHVFPEGTIIPDQCAVVVFGGGTPTGAFGGATVQTASTGSLGLNNGGDTITLLDDAAKTVVSVAYGGEGGQNQSLTRDPDVTGEFVLHSEANGSGGALFSPGTMIDGTSFSGCVIDEPACGDSDAGDCFEDNDSPYCSDEECCLAVCEVDPFCCDVEWNAACADEAFVVCRECGDPETGDCFQDNGTPYCRDGACCNTVCAKNSSCCEGPWNQECADLALANCAFNLPECNDVVFGLSRSNGVTSLELVRGPAEENGGAQIDDFWDGPFAQSVEFDNLDGISHNPQGNLLGMSFGSSSSGGSISSFATCSPPGAGALIGDTQGLGGEGLTLTRLGGLSVSPNNDKIAVGGYDSARVIVYDYTAGDCLGNGAALINARESDAILCHENDEGGPEEDTQGTAWLDNDTVLAFSTSGEIFAVDAGSMAATLITTVDTIAGCGDGFTDIEYVPHISPNVYAMYSAFSGGTINLLFVLDPSNNLDLLGTFNYSTSMNTTREIAFDVDGNLYATQFGSEIDVILDAASLDSLADDVSTDWYDSETSASFSGLDVAQCVTAVERTLIVKQGACPAPVNPNSNGVIPMLLVGDEDFDVSMVDLATLELRRCDGAGETATPLANHTHVADLNHPFGGEVGCGECACNKDQSSDGIGDLSLKFRTDTTLEALDLTAGDGVVGVELTGSLLDGSDFFARDCVVIVPPGSGQANATMQSNVPDTFIDVTPLDLNVDSDGFANFSRSYVSGTVVTVTAPTTSQGRRFLRWSVHNVLQPIGVRTMEVTVGENTTLRAYYQRASRVTPERPTAPSGDQE